MFISNILHIWFGVCFAGDQLRIIGEMSTGTNNEYLHEGFACVTGFHHAVLPGKQNDIKAGTA